MNKSLVRFIAVLVIPALLIDPSTASVWGQDVTHSAAQNSLELLNQQAIPGALAGAQFLRTFSKAAAVSVIVSLAYGYSAGWLAKPIQAQLPAKPGLARVQYAPQVILAVINVERDPNLPPGQRARVDRMTQFFMPTLSQEVNARIFQIGMVHIRRAPPGFPSDYSARPRGMSGSKENVVYVHRRAYENDAQLLAYMIRGIHEIGNPGGRPAPESNALISTLFTRMLIEFSQRGAIANQIKADEERAKHLPQDSDFLRDLVQRKGRVNLINNILQNSPNFENEFKAKQKEFQEQVDSPTRPNPEQALPNNNPDSRPSLWSIVGGIALALTVLVVSLVLFRRKRAESKTSSTQKVSKTHSSAKSGTVSSSYLVRAPKIIEPGHAEYREWHEVLLKNFPTFTSRLRGDWQQRIAGERWLLRFGAESSREETVLKRWGFSPLETGMSLDDLQAFFKRYFVRLIPSDIESVKIDDVGPKKDRIILLMRPSGAPEILGKTFSTLTFTKGISFANEEKQQKWLKDMQNFQNLGREEQIAVVESMKIWLANGALVHAKEDIKVPGMFGLATDQGRETLLDKLAVTEADRTAWRSWLRTEEDYLRSEPRMPAASALLAVLTVLLTSAFSPVPNVPLFITEFFHAFQQLSEVRQDLIFGLLAYLAYRISLWILPKRPRVKGTMEWGTEKPGPHLAASDGHLVEPHKEPLVVNNFVKTEKEIKESSTGGKALGALLIGALGLPLYYGFAQESDLQATQIVFQINVLVVTFCLGISALAGFYAGYATAKHRLEGRAVTFFLGFLGLMVGFMMGVMLIILGVLATGQYHFVDIPSINHGTGNALYNGRMIASILPVWFVFSTKTVNAAPRRELETAA